MSESCPTCAGKGFIWEYVLTDVPAREGWKHEDSRDYTWSHAPCSCELGAGWLSRNRNLSKGFLARKKEYVDNHLTDSVRCDRDRRRAEIEREYDNGKRDLTEPEYE